MGTQVDRDSQKELAACNVTSSQAASQSLTGFSRKSERETQYTGERKNTINPPGGIIRDLYGL